MGDGDHGWAAAEFLNLVRDMLVREERGQLLLLSGAPENWFHVGAVMDVVAAPTLHGLVSFHVEIGKRSLTVTWKVTRKSHQDYGDIFLCLPFSHAQALRIPGERKGSHMRIALPEGYGRRTYETPSSVESPSFVLQGSLHA